MIETPHGEDARRRVPVYSLYSETREPTAEMLRGRRRAGHRSAGRRHARLHLHLHDGQLHARRARGTASASSSAIARTRSAVSPWKGATLRPEFASFVGQFPIPLRHGLTIGELARLFNEEFGIGAALDVVPLDGWTRDMYFDADRAALGHPVAEPADARQRDRLSGRGAVRGDDALRGARHDAAVRADRRAVDRRRALADGDERARPAGRALPAGVLRADVPEAREADLRRLSAARARSRGVPAGPGRASS